MKNVGTDWTCTSAEYVVYILEKYVLIAGSVFQQQVVVVLMIED
jgi:hypothetical protein